MRDKESHCEQHDAPIFRLTAATEIGGGIRPVGFGFCRYCTEGRIVCPDCGASGTVLNFTVEGRIHGDGQVDSLRCWKEACNGVLVRAEASPE